MPNAIIMGLLYESKISEWVMNEVLNVKREKESEGVKGGETEGGSCSYPLASPPSSPPSSPTSSPTLLPPSSPTSSPSLPPSTACSAPPSSSSHEPCLRTFEKFVDLAIESCNIGDLCTTIAIVDALMSPGYY